MSNIRADCQHTFDGQGRYEGNSTATRRQCTTDGDNILIVQGVVRATRFIREGAAISCRKDLRDPKHNGVSIFTFI